MTFPRYPAYKDSGVTWLEEVPEHWEVKRLKQICHVFPSNVDKKSYDGETPVRLCNYTDVYYNERIVDSMEPMAATATTEQIEKFTLKAGDTIITKDSETADDIAIAAYVPEDLPGIICGYHLSMVRPKDQTCGLFVKRLFDSTYVKSKFEVLANGLTRVGLGTYALDNVEMPIPPAAEQTAIATFLDRETAKIDDLIAEQRSLTALLKEKRQAVISHAVTKGLNPDTPMKPSGVEWLGDVPEHWEVMPAKRVSSVFVPQRNKPDLNTDGEGHFWVTMEQMRNEEINSAEFSVTESAAKDAGTRVLSAGAVVASCVGTFGLAAINSVDVIINQQLQAFIPTDHIDAKFMRHCVIVAQCYFEQIGTSATIAYVNQLGFANMPMVLPPMFEQYQIVEFLALESAKFDTLTTEAQRAIDLLQERRTALISSAVTGQIDVRKTT